MGGATGAGASGGVADTAEVRLRLATDRLGGTRTGPLGVSRRRQRQVGLLGGRRGETARGLDGSPADARLGDAVGVVRLDVLRRAVLRDRRVGPTVLGGAEQVVVARQLVDLLGGGRWGSGGGRLGLAAGPTSAEARREPPPRGRARRGWRRLSRHGPGHGLGLGLGLGLRLGRLELGSARGAPPRSAAARWSRRRARRGRSTGPVRRRAARSRPREPTRRHTPCPGPRPGRGHPPGPRRSPAPGGRPRGRGRRGPRRGRREAAASRRRARPGAAASQRTSTCRPAAEMAVHPRCSCRLTPTAVTPATPLRSGEQCRRRSRRRRRSRARPRSR